MICKYSLKLQFFYHLKISLKFEKCLLPWNSIKQLYDSINCWLQETHFFWTMDFSCELHKQKGPYNFHSNTVQPPGLWVRSLLCVSLIPWETPAAAGHSRYQGDSAMLISDLPPSLTFVLSADRSQWSVWPPLHLFTQWLHFQCPKTCMTKIKTACMFSIETEKVSPRRVWLQIQTQSHCYG